ncbi:MAG: dihydrodipicolinate synthase [Bacteroidetes bacterium]|jgi:4-hydroxy-tetrahydrodipicolinate synthase|nr:dihydrodipicolinate synthase [Bacteroidota bacterium]
MAKQTKFRGTGTGVAIVTPFSKDGNIDFKGLSSLVEHLIKGKVDYLVVLGTTGESAVLNKNEKSAVINHVIDTAEGRIPLVLGIGGNSTQEVIDTIKHTDLKAFSAILSVSPYYNKPSQEGIYQHYKMIANASPLPIILYNVPARTSSNMTWETTVRLATEFRNIIAMKEASGNMEQCMKIIKHKPKDFALISGDDNLTLPLIACGAEGVISVVANAFPKDFSEMVRQAMAANMVQAQKLHYKLMEITEQLFADGNPGGIKAALEIMKICPAFVRLPLVKPNIKVQKRLAELIAEYK